MVTKKILPLISFFSIFSLVYAPSPKASAADSLKSPNISANTLFLYRNSNQTTATQRNGIDIEEGELNIYADVDPYSRLNMILTVHPEYTTPAGTPAGQAQEEWKVEPEELYAESSEVTHLTLKVGKFKAAFGKHNQLHTHVFPFINAPLFLTTLLGGEDGLNDVGVSGSYLLPTKNFSEITAQYLRGEGDNTEFNSPSSRDGVLLARARTLIDLTDEATVEVGASLANGANSDDRYTNLLGGDLTYKWRPAQGGKYKSLILGLEAVQRTRGQPNTIDETSFGGDVWGQYQFAERWSANVRYDQVTVRNTVDANLENGTTKRYSAGANFNATEFSSYRLEYSETDGRTLVPNSGHEKRIYLLGNFTIGSHPAHSY